MTSEYRLLELVDGLLVEALALALALPLVLVLWSAWSLLQPPLPPLLQLAVGSVD